MVKFNLKWFPFALFLVAVLAVVGACGGGDDDDAGDDSGDGNTNGSEPTKASTSGSEPTKASGGGSSSGDTGPAAGAGEGRFEVAGKTYKIAVTECSFIDSGPTKGSVDVKGTTDSGATFELSQFYLNDKWSQTIVELDISPTSKIYVIRSRATTGAEPAKVDGKKISWVEKFRDLDTPANTQKEVGEGKLNLTCQ